MKSVLFASFRVFRDSLLSVVNLRAINRVWSWKSERIERKHCTKRYKGKAKLLFAHVIKRLLKSDSRKYQSLMEVSLISDN